jgi:peptidyl-prolyl cis-trans isomerase C
MKDVISVPAYPALGAPRRRLGTGGMNLVALCFLFFFASAAPVYASDTPAARVNGTIITHRELEAAVDIAVPRSSFHGSVSEEKHNELRAKELDNLIVRELQYQFALRNGMKPDRKQVKSRLIGVRDRFKSKKEYRAALDRADLTEDQLRRMIEKDVLIQQITDLVTMEPAKVSEQELREYYVKNPDKFLQPESVKLRVISIKDRLKAENALERLGAGADFGFVAAQMSEDDFRIKGGDVGFIHRGRILPEVEAQAFMMRPGETSSLVQAGGRFYIIKVEEKKSERQMTYDEVSSSLRKELEQKRSSELKDKWLAEIRSTAEIEVLWTPQHE